MPNSSWGQQEVAQQEEEEEGEEEQEFGQQEEVQVVKRSITVSRGPTDRMTRRAEVSLQV